MTNEQFIVAIMSEIADLFEYEPDVTLLITSRDTKEEEMLMYTTCMVPSDLTSKLEKALKDEIRVVLDPKETDLERH